MTDLLDHPLTKTGDHPMNAHVTTLEPRTEVAVVSEAASLMEVISRAASDPNTDVDKFERLMAMYERVSDRSAEQAFNAAMNAAQSELGRVAADANNPQTKSKYASYPALDRVVRPVYSIHGFSLSFDTGDDAPADHVRVVCHVAHRDGHSRRYHVDMPADGKGAKGGDVMTKTHAAGAAMSYGQRYLLKLIFNIAVGEDDDGNSASGARERSAACQASIAALNGANTFEELKAQRAKNEALWNALPAPERKEVVELYNRRRSALSQGV